MPQNVTLSLELVNAVVGYLGTRPYLEVAHLIAETQKQVAPQVQQTESGTQVDQSAE